MTIKLVQLGEDGMACEGGVCAIPEPAAKAPAEKEKLAATSPLAQPVQDDKLAGGEEL